MMKESFPGFAGNACCIRMIERCVLMGKFFLFTLLWWLFGNPVTALLVMLILFYILDRRYVGLFPNVIRPIRQSRRLARIRQELRAQPHHTGNKLEAARILIEKKKYREALDYLEPIRAIMDDSAEVLYELGLCHLKLGATAEGEALILDALKKNPRVKYGEPYLRLGEAFRESDPDRAVRYLEQFREVQSSSCEAYYRLGQLYRQLGRPDAARRAFREAGDIYRGLPKYKRRTERRWALLSYLKRG